MSRKPTCYFLLTRLPFPPVGGDRLRYYHSIKNLKEFVDLYVVIISDETPGPDTLQFLREHVVSYKIFTYPKFRFRLNALRAIFSHYPIQVKYYFFREVKQFLEQKIKPDDLVISNLVRTALYALPISNKKYLDLIDSLYLNYSRSKLKVSSVFWKMMYTVEAKRLKSFEKLCVENFDATLFTNFNEKDYYEDKGNACWVPNGVDGNLLCRDFNHDAPPIKPTVVFLGKMDYQPNIDAALWFAEKVLNLNNQIHFSIIGSSPVKKIRDLEQRFPGSVTVTGFVEDPYILMHNATAVVAPMQTGGGIQNKILEAMAIGCVVLTTQLGAQPIVGAMNKQHLLICETPVEYVNAIMGLYNNTIQRNEIREQATALMKEKYTWQLFSKNWEKILIPGPQKKIDPGGNT